VHGATFAEDDVAIFLGNKIKALVKMPLAAFLGWETALCFILG
jgi:hypothetical protein